MTTFEPTLDHDLKRWLLELAKREASTGLTARRLRVLAVLRDLSSWTESPTVLNLYKRINDCFCKLLAILDLYESNGNASRLIVPLTLAKSVITECLAGNPVPKLDRTKEDYVADLRPSQIRTSIMAGASHRIRTTLTKRITRDSSSI